jgi:protein farnesyltransferase/geranylgeranyltransferase type-1 subunit alpha
MSEQTDKKREWVSYKSNPEWADVTPLSQDDGPHPVVQIAYSPQFVEVMDYFRAVVAAGEKSSRALKLTEDVIWLNSANYTAWFYRRLVLESLNADMRPELKFTADIADENPKNYQLWYHRRVIVEKLGDPSQEIAFTAAMIDDDAKNYHAWSHRQWVVETFKLWDQELQYLDSLLHKDPRNNSAWNQRYFVITKSQPSTSETTTKELRYTMKIIGQAPNNQSSWNYLKGYLRGVDIPKDFGWVLDWCLELKRRIPTCGHALSLLIDIYEKIGTVEKIDEAIQHCAFLANHLDQIHSKYWVYKKGLLEQKLKVAHI